MSLFPLFRWMKRRSPSTRTADRSRVFRPALEALEDRMVPAGQVLTIVGVDQGPPHVKVLGENNREVASFYAFDPAFQGGVRVGIGDVNNDGVQDYICGAGAGARAHVKVVDGVRAGQLLGNGQIADTALLASFIAFDPSVTSGVFVAGGDFDGDHLAEVAVGTAQGTAGRVRVFDIKDGTSNTVSGPLGDFTPYGADFLGGITLGAADVDGNGRDELVTGTFRGSSHLKTFDARTGAAVISELVYPGFNGGFSISTFDVNNDGRDDIITGGAVGAGGHIKILDGVTGQETSSYFGMGAGFNGGTRVATLGVTEGGVATLRVIGAPSSGGVDTINESTPDGVITGSIQPFGASFSGGLFVASSRVINSSNP